MREAPDAKPTAARSAAATKEPTPTTKKTKTAAEAVAVTKAPTKPATTREAQETKPAETRTAATTEAPTTPATNKRKTRTPATTTERKIMFAQFRRYERLIKGQEEERGRHALVDSHVYENCVEDVILHQREVEPYCASILKQGK